MNVYVPIPRLPSTYQEVEYIRTSGTQYINTGVSTNGRDNTELETDLRYYNNVSGSSQVNGKDNRYWFFVGVNSSNVFYAGAGGIWGETGVTNDRQKHNFKIKTSETNLYIDGIAYALPSNTGLDDTTGYIGIGAASRPNDGGGFYWKCVEDIFSFKIKQGGTLVRDFVPCYRKSDNVIGLYDLVNSAFYTNSGTGTFSKGNDVTMSVLKNAYIGEVWTPGSNTLLYLPLEKDATDYSGRSISTTASGVSYTTVGGVTSAHIGSTGGISVAAGAVTKDLANLTIAVLFYLPAATYSQRRTLMEFNNNSYCNFGILNSENGSTMKTGYFPTDMGMSFSSGTWTSFIVTGNADGYCLYKNGVLVTTGTGSSTPWWRGTGSSETGQYIFCGRNGTSHAPFVNGNLREVIFEKTKWSADEVSNYYSMIKQKLGL